MSELPGIPRFCVVDQYGLRAGASSFGAGETARKTAAGIDKVCIVNRYGLVDGASALAGGETRQRTVAGVPKVTLCNADGLLPGDTVFAGGETRHQTAVGVPKIYPIYLEAVHPANVYKTQGGVDAYFLCDEYGDEELVAYWPLAGASAVDLNDYSDSGLDLTNNNTAVRGDGPSDTLPDAVALAAASSQYLSITDKAALRGSVGDFTLAGWLVLNGDSDGLNRPFSKWNGTGNQREYSANVNGSNLLTFSASPDGTSTGNATVSNSNALTDGVWVYWTVGYDARRGVLFSRVNLTAEITQAIASVFGGTAAFEFGSLTAGSQTFNGNLSHWSRLNRVMASQEIAWRYNGGEGRDLTKAT